MDALIANARFHFHERLLEANTLTLTKTGIASNADASSRGSKAIAGKIIEILAGRYHHTVHTVDKISGQTLGKQFELLTMEFLRETFPQKTRNYRRHWGMIILFHRMWLFTGIFMKTQNLMKPNA